MPHLEQQAGLDDLIQQLRIADPSLRVFGSTSHQYKLGSTLSESELTAFENANRIKLPEDYRHFLATVGNGGAGPYYGLEPLETFERNLSQPFPLTQSTELLTQEELVLLGDRDEYPGILEFCHQGCAIYSYLVVNGPTYGTIWDGREDFYPTGLTFDHWFRSWAEGALRSLENEKLVHGLRVGMSKADVAAVLPANWKARQVGDSSFWLLEASEVPVQLELDTQGIVVKTTPWPFISARPKSLAPVDSEVTS